MISPQRRLVGQTERETKEEKQGARLSSWRIPGPPQGLDLRKPGLGLPPDPRREGERKAGRRKCTLNIAGSNGGGGSQQPWGAGVWLSRNSQRRSGGREEDAAVWPGDFSGRRSCFHSPRPPGARRTGRETRRGRTLFFFCSTWTRGGGGSGCRRGSRSEHVFSAWRRSPVAVRAP